MIKTSTLTTSCVTNLSGEKQEADALPEFTEPSAECINSILNYSKSLKVMKSTLIENIEVVNS